MRQERVEQVSGHVDLLLDLIDAVGDAVRANALDLSQRHQVAIVDLYEEWVKILEEDHSSGIVITDHVWSGVWGHPDDDECTYTTSDGLGCGEPKGIHEYRD